jgi:SsrA-binding protein
MSSDKIAINRKASFDYFILERYEAGLVLTGTEVKSLRERRVNLNEAYVKILQNQVFVVGMHVSPYSHIQNISAADPMRTRKLLLNKSEIAKLMDLLGRKGFTCIPLAIYFKKGRAKLQIGVAQAKKQHDKRESIKKRMDEKQVRQALKRRVS